MRTDQKPRPSLKPETTIYNWLPHCPLSRSGQFRTETCGLGTVSARAMWVPFFYPLSCGFKASSKRNAKNPHFGGPGKRRHPQMVVSVPAVLFLDPCLGSCSSRYRSFWISTFEVSSICLSVCVDVILLVLTTGNLSPLEKTCFFQD